MTFLFGTRKVIEAVYRAALDDGNSVHPLALADDDPDNHVIACIAETRPAVSVSVVAGFFMIWEMTLIPQQA